MKERKDWRRKEGKERAREEGRKRKTEIRMIKIKIMLVSNAEWDTKKLDCSYIPVRI